MFGEPAMKLPSLEALREMTVMKRTSIRNSMKFQYGLSLVEILIVIIILVFGVLSIIKIYPTGFLVMRNTSNISRADRLESAMLSSLSVGSNIPDAIYYPNVLQSSSASPTFNLTYDPSNALNLNYGTYISNQPFTVPSSTAVGGNPYGPMVVLPFGPINYEVNSPTSGAPFSYTPTVVSTNWKQIQASCPLSNLPTPSLTVTNAESEALTDGEYAVDTTNSAAYQIVFPTETNYAQVFYISYTSGGAPYAFAISLPAGNSFPLLTYPTIPTAKNTTGSYIGFWDSLPNLESAYGTTYEGGAPPAATSLPTTWDAGSLQIYRPLAPITGSFTSADPYQFQVDPNADIQTNVINLGVLLFNPNAAPNILGHPLKVLVSYYVYNWSILHEDDNLTSGQTVLDLQVVNIKDPTSGAVQEDQTLFTTLFPGSGATYPMVALDLDTGTLIPQATFASGTIDYEKGQIPLASGFATASPHVRFFYSTTDNLALALQKAPSQFQLTTSNNAAPAVLTSMTATSSTTPNLCLIDYSYNDSSDADQILFPASFAGQSVQLENVQWLSLAKQTYSLGNIVVNISASTEPVSGATVAYADVTSMINDAAQNISKVTGTSVVPASPGTQGALSVGSVGGVSSRAVCIWQESGKWKMHNVDSVIK